jgi:3D (Asp-Asp-Asp) domain-containing protein
VSSVAAAFVRPLAVLAHWQTDTMKWRLGPPIAGVSLLLAPMAWPQTVEPAAATPQAAEAQLLRLRPAEPLPSSNEPPAQMITSQDAAARQSPDGARPNVSPGEGDRLFGLKATLYITTKRDSGKDSIGCHLIPMRTAAVDDKEVRRHTILFIKETVGLTMPDGQVHDGYWYATDVGSAIVPGRIDLYTGRGLRSIVPYLNLNLKTLTVTKVGRFSGCPHSGAAMAVSTP